MLRTQGMKARGRDEEVGVNMFLLCEYGMSSLQFIEGQRKQCVEENDWSEDRKNLVESERRTNTFHDER